MGCTDGIDAKEDENKKEPEIVPDSMPLGQDQNQAEDEDIFPSAQHQQPQPTQLFSDTTFGDTDTDSMDMDMDKQPQPIQPGPPNDRLYPLTHAPDLTQTMHQNQRPLGEYLAYAEHARFQLPPRKREGRVVEAFLEGLDETEVRVGLEREMDYEGWAWEVMKRALSRVIWERQQRCISISKDAGGSPGREKAVYKRKSKRCIPIAPADDDDDDSF